MNISLQFREGNIDVISDIEKAFLQIRVDPAERDSLRFMWYDAKGDLIRFRHCRVLFGLCSSPFMLLHCFLLVGLINDNYVDR